MCRLLPDVSKIAALRSGGLSEYLHALPALEALRKAYPGGEIVLIGKEWLVEFLAGRPGPVDRVIALPQGHIASGQAAPDQADGPQEARDLARFFDELRAEHFDLALQLHGGGRRSNPLILRLEARMTAGLRTPEAPLLDRWLPYLHDQNDVLRLLEAVALVGALPVVLEPRLALTEHDLEEARRLLAGVDDEAPLVVLSPGASDARRRWPTGNFAAVGDALASAGAIVLLTGKVDEAGLCRAVAESMEAKVIDLCGKLSLSGLTGVLARSRLIVSNDTGALHLAMALGAPAVGIFWCGDFLGGGPMTFATHRSHIGWRLSCPMCGRNNLRARCGHNASFVADVPAEEATASALDLFTSGIAPPRDRMGPLAFTYDA